MKKSHNAAWIKFLTSFIGICRQTGNLLVRILKANVYVGRSIAGLPPGSIVLFPCHENILCCGIAAIVSYNLKEQAPASGEITPLAEMVTAIEAQGCEVCKKSEYEDIKGKYLGGNALIDSLWQAIQNLKLEKPFFSLFTQAAQQKQLEALGRRLNSLVTAEERLLGAGGPRL